MKAFNTALLCLATTAVPFYALAITPMNANLVRPQARPTQRVSQTIQLLQQDPLQIQALDMSDDEKNALMDEVIRASENPPAAGAQAPRDSNGYEGLIHNANFFDDLFGGGQQWGGQQPWGRPYDPSQGQPQDPYPRQVPDYSAIKMPKAPVEPKIIFDHESMKDPNDWKVKYFDVVVVINKSRTGQNVYVYSKLDNGTPVLVKSGVKVSTGRETAELSNEERFAVGLPQSGHAPKTSYFSNTPTGYFTPIRFSIDHVSGDWEDSAMDHAIFFHSRGIATHRAPVGSESLLGRRASGACVRMSRSDARDLFWLIRRTGGPITQGELNGGRFERSTPGPSFAKEWEKLQENGATTYEKAPEIPVFDRNGEVKYLTGEDGKIVLDAEGQPIPEMRKALARTLIVVEDREIERKTPTRERKRRRR